MEFKLKYLIILAALSIYSIVLYGCSVTSPAVYENSKFHIYDFKTMRIIRNLSDSTEVCIFKTPDYDNSFYHDKTVLDLFGNGILTYKHLNDAYNKNGNWYEFDAIQPEIIRTSSEICKDYLDEEKAIYLSFSLSHVEADSSKLYRFGYMQFSDDTVVFELKEIKQGHFAIRFWGCMF